MTVSVLTLDSELAGDDFGNSNANMAMLQNRFLASTRNRHYEAENLLWGFDEDASRSRFDRIQKRLIKLESALFEEFDTRIDLASKDCLLKLFIACPSVAAPLISGQPDGGLAATWRSGNKEELAIKCVSPTLLHYSIVSASLTIANKLDRQWGTFHSAPLFFKEHPLARRIAG